jgi:hypothetical protein
LVRMRHNVSTTDIRCQMAIRVYLGNWSSRDAGYFGYRSRREEAMIVGNAHANEWLTGCLTGTFTALRVQNAQVFIAENFYILDVKCEKTPEGVFKSNAARGSIRIGVKGSCPCFVLWYHGG